MEGMFMVGADRRGRFLFFVALAALILASMAIRLPVLMEPWGGDQGGFGYVAKAILEGKVPYKDVYDLTGYGVFFTFSLFFTLFGMSMMAPHLGHLLVSVITVIIVFVLARRIFGQAVAWVAAISCSLFGNGLAFSGFGYENMSAWGTYWYLSQREVFMAPLMAGAVLLVANMPGKRGWRSCSALFLVGALLGLTAIYKLTVIVMLGALLAFLGYDEVMAVINQGSLAGGGKAGRVAAFLGRSSIILTGFVVVQMPFIYYFWIHDALRDVYESLFVHVAAYANLSRGLRIEALLSGHYSVAKENLVLWLFAAISGCHILFRNRNRKALLAVVWGAASLAMVWGQGKFFGYHFIILIPPFATLAGYGLMTFVDFGDGLREFIRRNVSDIRKCFMVVTTLLTLVGFGIMNYDYYRWHLLYLKGKISKIEYYGVFTEFPTHAYSFRGDYQVTEYLRPRLQKNERLGLIFGAGDTVIHFLLDTEDVTRFLQSWYLFSPDEYLAHHEVTKKLQSEFVNQLTSAMPRYILLVHLPMEELMSTPTLINQPAMIQLETFIRENYELRKRFIDNRFLFENIDARRNIKGGIPESL